MRVEIYSDKIDGELLEKEIKRNLKNFSKKPRQKRSPQIAPKSVAIAPTEYCFKSYDLMKKAYRLLQRIGLGGVATFLKDSLKKTDLLDTQVYVVSDFTQFCDEEFIRVVYRTLLKREPDDEALQHYLFQLRSGMRTKSEILSIIRFSKEGRIHKVKILGIKKRFVLAVVYSLPVVGYFAKSAVTLLTLPKLRQRYNALEASYQREKQILLGEINKKVSLDDFHKEMSKKVSLDDFQKEMSKKVSLDDFQKEMSKKVNLDDLFNEIIKINRHADNLQRQFDAKIETSNKELSAIKRYLRSIERSLASSSHSLPPTRSQPATNQNDLLALALEEFYISFEERFRGKREEIKKRQAYYLPFIKEIVRGDMDIVVDVGCGRGEWLELLSQNGITARGVDINEMMVEISREYNLDAIKTDALEYLRSLEENSIAAVTGFHIVEHLPFAVLINLMDEALRVLKKGGMVVFETPNPENLLVGSCSFYTDPTHINPIPPVTLEFIAHNRGFERVSIHRLHPLKEPQYPQGLRNEDIDALIASAAKEQDYAVIGYKG